jgi:hypothetical protein
MTIKCSNKLKPYAYFGFGRCPVGNFNKDTKIGFKNKIVI